MSGAVLDLAGLYAELRRACREAGGQKAWAEARGLSQQYVSDVMNARREPGPKLLAALGLVKVTRYAHARIPARPAGGAP